MAHRSRNNHKCLPSTLSSTPSTMGPLIFIAILFSMFFELCLTSDPPPSTLGGYYIDSSCIGLGVDIAVIEAVAMARQAVRSLDMMTSYFSGHPLGQGPGRDRAADDLGHILQYTFGIDSRSNDPQTSHYLDKVREIMVSVANLRYNRDLGSSSVRVYCDNDARWRRAAASASPDQRHVYYDLAQGFDRHRQPLLWLDGVPRCRDPGSATQSHSRIAQRIVLSISQPAPDSVADFSRLPQYAPDPRAIPLASMKYRLENLQHGTRQTGHGFRL
ncbi:hypothetical protein EJ05DRAFT_536870 [Pseudovirgaria hyperparasitica]|uniref:Uncharacterized protein n=1 Tax=Pseudovirgaria hyperparasitica TaxID=470096 RepID=A0A6A6WDF2_9PEZI|nr:uncharacterized protein EJ05DRAFT_536870 [Pseudovirgaria hyperparasitica]KAF2759587.1 hypothetical protein EJ05DRAFT_536870 [Pseudovirgaria hyperparasitica]